MPTTEPQLNTVGVIAEKLSVPLHRVLYVLKTKSDINPVARVGRTRVYDRSAIEKIRAELESMDDPSSLRIAGV